MAPMISCVTAPAAPASVSLSERMPYSLSCVSRRTVSLPAVAVMMTSGRAARTRRPDLPDIGSEVLGPERRIGGADVAAPEPLDVVLERRDGRAAHLVVGTDEEIALAGNVLDQPPRQRGRLHESV